MQPAGSVENLNTGIATIKKIKTNLQNEIKFQQG